MFRELLDRIAAVAQDALAAVDEGDVALAAGGGAVAGVEGEVAQLLVQAADVEGRIPFAAGDDGKIERLAGFRVVQAQLAFRHDGTPWNSLVKGQTASPLRRDAWVSRTIPGPGSRRDRGARTARSIARPSWHPDDRRPPRRAPRIE